MNASRAATIAWLAALAVLVFPGAARAGCMDVEAVDTCLVGTWKQTGGGPAEWLKQNMKAAKVSIDLGEPTITLKSDGTFASSKIEAKAEVEGKDGKTIHGAGQIDAGEKGQWSAGDGTLNLCVDAVKGQGMVEFQLPGKAKVRTRMPQLKPSRVSMNYTCEGDTLSTIQPMPKDTTMTTTYARVR